MKTSRSPVRGYLSQVAEPVQPREPMLAVRRGAYAPRGVERIEPPAIEDDVEIVRRTASPARPPTPTPRQAPTPVGPVAPISIARPVTSEPVMIEKVASPTPFASNPPVKEATPIQPAEAAPVEAAPTIVRHDQPPLFNPAPHTKTERPHEPEEFPPPVTPPLVHTTAEGRPTIELASASRTADRDFAPQHASAAPEPPPTQTSVRPEWPTAREAPETPDHEPKPHPHEGANEGARPGEPIRSNEPRVRIGTVEIRATLPPPPVAPQPRVEPQPHDTRAQAAPQTSESLARGLGWSYGLVQG